jgi:6-phospho-3-hexuloisomerase
MSDGTLASSARPVLAELERVFARTDGAIVTQLADEILGARRVLMHSAGRTGLMLRALVMRLFHLGLDAHFVGDMTAPPIGVGDLLLVNASTGDLPSGLAHIASARRVGARTAVITAAREAPALSDVDRVILLPGQTMLDDLTAAERSILPMGSQYELALLVLSELVVVELMRRRGLDFSALRARHANIL